MTARECDGPIWKALEVFNKTEKKKKEKRKKQGGGLSLPLEINSISRISTIEGSVSDPAYNWLTLPRFQDVTVGFPF